MTGFGYNINGFGSFPSRGHAPYTIEALVLAGGGGGFLMLNGTGALRLQPAMEFQYFFMGLDNLSFTAGVGLNVDVGAGNSKVELASSMLGGLHYWF